MCRWFAYISPTEPCLLSDVLITPVNSISKQCSEHYLPNLLPHGGEKELDHTSDELLRMRNSLLNMDGLGIACTYAHLDVQPFGDPLFQSDSLTVLVSLNHWLTT